MVTTVTRLTSEAFGYGYVRRFRSYSTSLDARQAKGRPSIRGGPLDGGRSPDSRRNSIPVRQIILLNTCLHNTRLQRFCARKRAVQEL